MEDAESIEERIRTEAVTKGIRPKEFFYDYDKLRSGFVTETQFFRVLWENFKLKFNDKERSILVSKYNTKKDGKVNYRLFYEIINNDFDPKQVSLDPQCQLRNIDHLYESNTSMFELKPDQEKRIEALLKVLQKFYSFKGINLSKICSQFDVHQNGLITRSQFFRSIIRPSTMSDEDLTLLVDKYGDHANLNFVNYLKLVKDLSDLDELVRQEKSAQWPQVEDLQNSMPKNSIERLTIDDLLDKLCIAAYKFQIRSRDFFRDYDKLRTGLVSSAQFSSALSLALGKAAELTEQDVNCIAAYFQVSPDRVNYRNLCEMLEFAFSVKDLEKKPSENVQKPLSGLFGRKLQMLSAEEEDKIVRLVKSLKDEMNVRRPLLYQFFQDFEKGGFHSRTVTPSQFARVLTQQGFSLTSDSMRLLCKKFAMSSSSNLINYPAFVQAIDQGFVNYKMQKLVEKCENEIIDCLPEEGATNLEVSIESVLEKIRSYVLKNRIKISEYFRDYDPLRSGLTTLSQFHRALDLMGGGRLHLTQHQFTALASLYKDKQLPGYIRWNIFEKDINIVFTTPSLEKNPTATVLLSEMFLMPDEGTRDWNNATDAMKEKFSNIISIMQKRITFRNVDVRAIFRMFDKLRHGHVTRSRFRQVLDVCEFKCTDDDLMTLEAKYSNNEGVNYILFIRDLFPADAIEEEDFFSKRKDLTQFVNEEKQLPEIGAESDINMLLNKIKIKLLEKNVRVGDWMKEHDPLNHGRISRLNFSRAIAQCQFELAKSEVDLLAEHFSADCHAGVDAKGACMVDYLRLVDELESVFCKKHLEKTPTQCTELFRPLPRFQRNHLQPDEEEILQRCLKLIAKKMKILRPSLLYFFRDFDVTGIGSVSRSQFRRVLTQLSLDLEIPSQCTWMILFNKFATMIGGSQNVDYITFCNVINDLINVVS